MIALPDEKDRLFGGIIFEVQMLSMSYFWANGDVSDRNESCDSVNKNRLPGEPACIHIIRALHSFKQWRGK